MSAFPTPPEKFPPFWYGTYSGLWIYYQVDWKLAQAILGKFTDTGNGPGFTAFPFWDKDYQNGNEPFALVCLNFMAYGAQSGSNDPRAYEQILDPLTPPFDPDNGPPGFGMEPASETELSVIAIPTARARQAPGKDFTAQAFLAGSDHTKTLGPFRLFVPCDDRIAVFWGTLNFGENKFMTRPFIYSIPSPNNLNPATMQLTSGWSFVIPGAIEEPNYAYYPKTQTCSPFILQASIDCTGFEALLGNPSEILDYSMWTEPGGAKRPVGSRRNMFGTFSTWLFTSQQQPKYSYTLGNSSHPMLQTLGELLGTAPKPFAAQVFQTQPVISESGTYYVDL
jgi:hypothetical protein